MATAMISNGNPTQNQPTKPPSTNQPTKPPWPIGHAIAFNQPTLAYWPRDRVQPTNQKNVV
ncbi:MAG: hypothetical protein F6J98_37490 [Moorea sp. SIO4G2]|uniref:Uncharacterized protein n=1 Tax=Moorena bouillonii PNG TaxID=568701 RepID=A0A1U7N5I6_9CYAN|nr:hypothetical protein [Moorena sp. SIO4G2]OLT61220.1 hypothetical protein BJP37_21565 [Moorena bouillonii PNG]